MTWVCAHLMLLGSREKCFSEPDVSSRRALTPLSQVMPTWLKSTGGPGAQSMVFFVSSLGEMGSDMSQQELKF